VGAGAVVVGPLFALDEIVVAIRDPSDYQTARAVVVTAVWVVISGRALLSVPRARRAAHAHAER
jgi:hypothetical protein